MMYASKIPIDRNPQSIRVERQVVLQDNLLSLKLLREHVTEEDFFSVEEDEYLHAILKIFNYRLETEEEVSRRIASAEKYNENYEIFHAKYNRSK